MEEARKAIKAIIDLVASEDDDKKTAIAKELRAIWGAISQRIKEETSDVLSVPDDLRVHIIRLREVMAGPITQSKYLKESVPRWTDIAYELYQLLMDKMITMFTYSDLRNKIDELTTYRTEWTKENVTSEQEEIFRRIGDIYVKIE
jgi:hypothetical protein